MCQEDFSKTPRWQNLMKKRSVAPTLLHADRQIHKQGEAFTQLFAVTVPKTNSVVQGLFFKPW
jgi:hypothetical protein